MEKYLPRVICVKVSTALDVSLKHIDTYRTDKIYTILIDQETDSVGRGVTDILSTEL